MTPACGVEQVLALATTLLYSVIRELELLTDTASHLPALLSKVWKHISGVQYLYARSHLHDITKPPNQRQTECIKQLEKILHAKETHPGLKTSTLRLEARTLRRLGMSLLSLQDWDKAVDPLEKLLALEQVRI
jgi:hypothetical protein